MARKKVLVVDDDKNLARVTQLTLEQSGLYDVRVVNQPGIAARTAKEFLPDLILMDVIMPDMDGGTVAAQIREDQRLKNIPIIFFTSMVDKNETREHNGIIGTEQFLAKPTSIPILLEAVRKAIGESKTGNLQS